MNFKTVKTHNIITNGNRKRTKSIWSEAKKGFVEVFATEWQEVLLDGHTYESAQKVGVKLNLVEPLLEIKLHDHNSVPEVRIGGNLIKGKTKIMFDWETDDETGEKPTRFLIEHLEEGSVDVVRIKLDTNEVGRQVGMGMKINNEGVQKIANGLAKDIGHTVDDIQNLEIKLANLIEKFKFDLATLESLGNSYEIEVPQYGHCGEVVPVSHCISILSESIGKKD